MHVKEHVSTLVKRHVKIHARTTAVQIVQQDVQIVAKVHVEEIAHIRAQAIVLELLNKNQIELKC